MVFLPIMVLIQALSLQKIWRIQIEKRLRRQPRGLPADELKSIQAVEGNPCLERCDFLNAADQFHFIVPGVNLPLAGLVQPTDDAAIENARAIRAVEE